jgi:hypothetical protein
MIPAKVDLPPGLVGVITSDLSRFANFQACIFGLMIPNGSAWIQIRGNDIAANRNLVVGSLGKQHEWIWFIDDDHTFHGEILLRLLSRGVDIIQPLVCTRKPPYLPYAYDGYPTWRNVGWDELPSGQAILEVGAVGTGGMLVRRAVLDAIGQPWFKAGKTGADHLGEDLWFCEEARRKGFRCYVDLENSMGHVGTHEVWPTRVDNAWRIELDLYHGIKARLPCDFASREVTES